MAPTRRTLIQALALSPLALALGVPALAQSEFITTALGGNLTLISGAGANVVVVVGADAAVVVDGGLDAHAEALLALIDRLTGGKPIAALFNTNWRADKSGLNQKLAARGVPIIAHENTRLWQNADFYSEWQHLDHAPLPKDTQATTTFYDTGTLALGNERIEYGWLGQASTDGDIYLRFQSADVLVVGDMLSVGAYPLLDYVTGGWIGGAQKTTRSLLAMSTETTRIVAAQGGVLNKTQLEQQAAMLDHAYTKVADAFKTGRSLAEFRATDPMQPFNAEWGNPEMFLTLLYKGTWYHIPGRAVPGII
ncbi:MAG: MBL fold metallo-hydrolase [Pseudomonadales bacterium]|jgi:glyoxylase-like metal-dependent hydrolase (beta-lactamase superfamily II)|nr:MBL fold metallo-hydrolase [Pseudomonadales bacterium]